MKRTVLVLLLFSTVALVAFGGVYFGGGVIKELGNAPETQGMLFEGRLTLGEGGLSLDLIGTLPQQTEENMGTLLQFFTYLNLNIPISQLEIYAGFSPTLVFYNGQFWESFLREMGYVHAGIAFKIKPVRLYAEAITYIVYSPFKFGNEVGVCVGAQIGF